MKRFLLIFLSCVLLFAVACEKSDNYEIPDYSTDEQTKEMALGMFIGVPNVIKTFDSNGALLSSKNMPDEDFIQCYKDIKAAGFTFTMQGYGETLYTPAFAMRSLNAAKEVGVGQLLQDLDLNKLLLYSDKTDKQIIETAKLLAESYKDHEAFAGNIIIDEPTAALYDNIARAKKLYEQAFPGKMFYVNLLPVIAGTAVGTPTYSEYISSFIEKVDLDYVSYDHYPLLQDAYGRTKVEPTFLYNMEMVKSLTKQYGKEFWTILQSIGYASDHRLPTDFADISWQAYAAMAYGVSGIQWFCYGSPPPFDGATTFTEGIIGYDGSKTEVYNFVSKLHSQLKKFDHVYLNFDWQGVMTVIGSSNLSNKNASFNYLNDTLSSHKRINSVKAEQDTLIGTFKDFEQRDGFMFVNYSNPADKVSSKLNVKFNDAVAALIYRDGEPEIIKLTSGNLEINMKAGEGVFVIPLKGVK